MSFDGLLEALRVSPSLIPLVVLVVALGEAIIFTSPIMPATVLLLGIGALQHAVGGSLGVIIAAAAIGTFVGDVASYALGRAYRDRIGEWRPFRTNPTLLPRSVAFMHRWGAPGLVATKFLGPLRWFGPTVSGVLQMPLMTFIVVTAFASIVWSALVLSPAYYGAKSLTQKAAPMPQASPAYAWQRPPAVRG